MGLKIEMGGYMGSNYKLKERLYTVPDGSRLADRKGDQRILLGAPGHEIPMHVAISLGLVDADEKEAKEKAEKEAKEKGENKNWKKGESK